MDTCDTSDAILLSCHQQLNELLQAADTSPDLNDRFTEACKLGLNAAAQLLSMQIATEKKLEQLVKKCSDRAETWQNRAALAREKGQVDLIQECDSKHEQYGHLIKKGAAALQILVETNGKLRFQYRRLQLQSTTNRSELLEELTKWQSRLTTARDNNRDDLAQQAAEYVEMHQHAIERLGTHSDSET